MELDGRTLMIVGVIKQNLENCLKYLPSLLITYNRKKFQGKIGPEIRKNELSAPQAQHDKVFHPKAGSASFGRKRNSFSLKTRFTATMANSIS